MNHLAFSVSKDKIDELSKSFGNFDRVVALGWLLGDAIWLPLMDFSLLERISVVQMVSYCSVPAVSANVKLHEYLSCYRFCGRFLRPKTKKSE